MSGVKREKEIVLSAGIMRQIHLRRKALGITARALAQRAGYGHCSILEWEAGRKVPSLAAVTNLLLVLGGKLEFSWDPLGLPASSAKRRNLDKGRMPRNVGAPETGRASYRAPLAASTNPTSKENPHV